ncbi:MULTISPECIES: hypothetical protein [unclassified Microbacterium]|uniref:hypothetical protein n=1 Tax=unclassified Microbacterium TaxID=2609290 RepID=UPI00144392C6|nr:MULTISPECIES: hypothetical protein [unclassified Microbacterium]
MKPFVWRGDITGRWWVSGSPDLEALPGTDPGGYDSWREAYAAACVVIAAEPA